MRKIYSLITAACLTATVTASAGVINRHSDDSRSNLFTEHFSKRVPENVANLAKQSNLQPGMNINGMSIKGKPAAHKAQAPRKIDAAADELITAPEGKVVQYYRNSFATYYYYYWLFQDQDYGYAAEVVFGDNGDVYFSNPISTIITGSYLKGHLEDGVITVSFPQKIYEDDDEDYGYSAYYAYLLEFDEDEYDATPVETQELKFSYAEDGTIKQIDEDDNLMIGLCEEDGTWIYYGDGNYEFLPFNDSLVEVPEDASVEEYAFTNDTSNHMINIAKAGNDVYFQGLSSYLPETWVKGSISGDEVSVPSGQYAGIDYYHYVYFYGAQAVEEYYEDWDYYYTSYELQDALTLQYDAATDTYTFPENTGVVFNLGKETYYADDSFIGYQITKQGDVTESTPATPEIYGFEPFDDDYGYGCFAFTMDNVDTEGNILPTDQLYYNIIVDDEPFTLYSDEYNLNGLDELTDIPYDFTDEENYDIYSYGSVHYFYFYIEGFDTMGVQVIYKSTNGNEYRSEIAKVDVSGTKSIINDNKTVTSETYYDLTGRIINNPTNGLFIKKTNFADGSTKAIKVVK